MECPRCRQVQLTPFRHKSGLMLDLCKQCRGFWFDADELDRVLDVAVKDLRPPRQGEQPPRSMCPKCHRPMVPFCYPQTMVTIDMCRDCRGIWLDRGEFEEIRTIRRALRAKDRLEEYAPLTGVKGALIRYINSAISQLTSMD